MPLQRSLNLASLYALKLQNNSISDEDLLMLSREFVVDSSHTKDPYLEVSDRNFSQLDLMQDFARIVCPMLSGDTLHKLTGRLITNLNKSRKADDNQIMRQNSLDKIFFSYESVHFPKSAEEHYSLPVMKNTFKTSKQLNTFKTVILSHCMDVFENPAGVAERLRLRQSCQEYLQTLQPKAKEPDSLAQQKRQIVDKMLSILNNPSIKFTDARKQIDDLLNDKTRATLEAKTNLKAGQFLMNVVNKISNKLDKASLKALKSKGETFLSEIDNDNRVNLPK